MGHVIYLIVEGLILLVVAFLNWYSGKRMGLNRHFVFEHYRFEQWAEEFPFYLIMGVFLSLIIIAVFLLLRRGSNLGSRGRWHLIFLLLLVGLLACISFFESGQEVMIAPYLYILFPILILGNLLGLYLEKKQTKKASKSL